MKKSLVFLSGLHFICSSFLLLGWQLLLMGSVQAEVKAGDILVTDAFGGTNGRGALIRVDPTTGNRTVLSDFGDASQGSLGTTPTGVTVFYCLANDHAETASDKVENRNSHRCSDGETVQIFVSDYFGGGPDFNGVLFKIDPNTGHRVIISDFGQGNVRGVLSYGLVVNAKSKVTANLNPSSDFIDSVLVRVDPESDTRVITTDLFNPEQGKIDSGTFITDLAIEHSGKILIATANVNDFAISAIMRVNPNTGKRTLLSDFKNSEQGPNSSLYFAAGLTTEASKQILVVTNAASDENNNIIGGNSLMRIDPETGQRTVLTDFSNPVQGILGEGPRGAVVDESGTIIVSAFNAESSGVLFRVNPETGQRTILSDSANLEQGPPLTAGGITYLAIVSANRGNTNED